MRFTPVAISISICALLLGYSVPLQASSLVFTNGEWPPFMSASLPNGGLITQKVTRALAFHNVKVSYEYYPWGRAYSLAKEGQYPATIAWAPTAQRREEFYFSDPIFYGDKVFFHLKSLPFDWKDIRDLKSYNIGATQDYTYGQAFDDAVVTGTIKVSFAIKDTLNVKKLLAGRIDLFPMDKEVGRYLIARLPPSQSQKVTFHPTPVLSTPYHVLVSRAIDKSRAKQLLDWINVGLRATHQTP